MLWGALGRSGERWGALGWFGPPQRWPPHRARSPSRKRQVPPGISPARSRLPWGAHLPPEPPPAAWRTRSGSCSCSCPRSWAWGRGHSPGGSPGPEGAVGRGSRPAGTLRGQKGRSWKRTRWRRLPEEVGLAREGSGLWGSPARLTRWPRVPGLGRQPEIAGQGPEHAVDGGDLGRGQGMCPGGDRARDPRGLRKARSCLWEFSAPGPSPSAPGLRSRSPEFPGLTGSNGIGTGDRLCLSLGSTGTLGTEPPPCPQGRGGRRAQGCRGGLCFPIYPPRLLQLRVSPSTEPFPGDPSLSRALPCASIPLSRALPGV